MLFDRNIEPSCSYCHYGSDLGRDEYACVKNGIMHGFGYCGAFRYEPTKRVPVELPIFLINAEPDTKEFTL